MKTVLLTWWTWYIGSHWAIELLELWYNVIIVDNLYNSDIEVVSSIEKITWKKVKFYEIDLKNKEDLKRVFVENNIDYVIHFAWYKAVGESCEKPFMYYGNNIIWSLNLFELMDEFAIKNIIFSSSATVYDPSLESPFVENDYTWNTSNPYWTTKLIIENILRDLSNHRGFRVVDLRYFNPIWAHKSWFIWEDPNDIPNNLLPYIMKVAAWELQEVWVFWNDYDTRDWTWERDYIHVIDLIDWHIKSIWYLDKFADNKGIFEVFNLWTWKSTSVLEMIQITSEVVWFNINFVIKWRRVWDLATVYCNPKKAEDILWWKPKFSVKEAILDSWNFVKNKKNIW